MWLTGSECHPVCTPCTPQSRCWATGIDDRRYARVNRGLTGVPARRVVVVDIDLGLAESVSSGPWHTYNRKAARQTATPPFEHRGRASP